MTLSALPETASHALAVTATPVIANLDRVEVKQSQQTIVNTTNVSETLPRAILCLLLPFTPILV